MPYIYQMAVKSHKTGIPSMRSMVMEFETDPAVKYLDMQYMLGDSILVAPIFSADGTVEYYLPEETWTHLLSGEVKQGGRWYKETYDFMSLPVYVRENTLLAIGSNEKTADYDYADGVQIQVYELKEGAEAQCSVPEKDGEAALEIRAARKDGKLVLESTGKNTNMTYLLRNVHTAEKIEGAEIAEDAEAGIVLRPIADRVVIG